MDVAKESEKKRAWKEKSLKVHNNGGLSDLVSRIILFKPNSNDSLGFSFIVPVHNKSHLKVLFRGKNNWIQKNQILWHWWEQTPWYYP